jgi:hypothetical protein
MMSCGCRKVWVSSMRLQLWDWEPNLPSPWVPPERHALDRASMTGVRLHLSLWRTRQAISALPLKAIS